MTHDPIREAMPMHCPHCRLENATTTRFCTSCGAVLVESTSDGGRRRVLRPWGMGSSAPLTESPAMPDLAAAHVLTRDGKPVRARRFPWMLGGGLALLAVAGMLAYPFAQADQPRAGSPAATLVTIELSQPTRVAAETKLMAPALVEPAIGKSSRKTVPPKSAATTASPLVAQPRVAPAPRDPALAVAYPTSSRDHAVGDGRSVDPTAELQAPQPVAAAETPDRWQSLRDALAACGAQTGLFARAACEQRARIAGCDSHWGEVALCPQARYDERR